MRYQCLKHCREHKSYSLENLRINWLRYRRKGSQAKIFENSKQTSYINLCGVLLVLLIFKIYIMLTTFELREYRITEERNIIFEDVIETINANESAVNYLTEPTHETPDYFYEWVCIGTRAERLHNILNS